MQEGFDAVATAAGVPRLQQSMASPVMQRAAGKVVEREIARTVPIVMNKIAGVDKK